MLGKIRYPSAQPHVHCSHISWVSLMPDWSEFRAKYQLICRSLIRASPPLLSYFFCLSLPLTFILVSLHSLVASELNSRDKGCSYTHPLDQGRFTPTWLYLPWAGILFSHPHPSSTLQELDWGGQSIEQTQVNQVCLDLQHRLFHLTSTSLPLGRNVELPHMHLPWPDLLSQALCGAMTPRLQRRSV